MAEILLVNPRRRKRRKHSKWGRVKSHSRRVNPRRRRRRIAARRRYTNPRRRRYTRRAMTRRYRRRSNPSLRGSMRGITGAVVPTVKAGFVGAAGAIGLDLLWGYGSRYLPAQIAGSAIAQYAAKLLGAILVGVVGNKVLRGRGRDLSVGAATVVLHDALKAQLKVTFPGLQLGEYLSYAPTVGTMRRAGRLLDTGMGEYLSGLPNTEDNGNYSGDFTSDGMNGY